MCVLTHKLCLLPFNIIVAIVLLLIFSFSLLVLITINCVVIFHIEKDRANEIYKRVEDLKSSRGRNQDAILAACLYIACRQEDKPRTVKGIALS